MRPQSLHVLLAALLMAGGCGQDTLEQEAMSPAEPRAGAGMEPLSVYAVNYPLQYFAERIGGDFVTVILPVPPDVDPAYWNPDPETIAAYQQADLILLNGLGYAKWMERASLPVSKLVDTSVHLGDRRIELEEASVHSHGPEGEHSHKGYAFTAWLSPELAIDQAREIAGAFVRARPEQEETFEANLATLVADLEALDQRLAGVASQLGDQPVIFSHPVYQYLEARYSLVGRSLHWEPDQEPSSEQWRELEVLLAEHPARWMIWEQEPTAATRERLAAMGVGSVVYDPCGNRPDAGDWLSVMTMNVENLARVGPVE